MNFKQIVEKNFNEWKIQGYCQEAIDLNSKIQYFDTTNPGCFTGDIHAPLVLVHLNPKRNRDDKEEWGKKCADSDFEAYWNRHVHFGKNMYGKEVEKKHISPFDLKQVRFLKPFGLFSFNDDKYHDLEMVMEQKLQLDLIPFGSPDFDYRGMDTIHLKPFIDRLLDLILECERKYVIFCGRVFCEVLKNFIVKEKTHSFKLIKKEGEDTQNDFSVINIKLQYNDSKIITACIAPQFALQGCPIDKYGKAVSDLYGNFDEKPKVAQNDAYKLINPKK